MLNVQMLNVPESPVWIFGPILPGFLKFCGSLTCQDRVGSGVRPALETPPTFWNKEDCDYCECLGEMVTVMVMVMVMVMDTVLKQSLQLCHSRIWQETNQQDIISTI